MYRNIVKPFFDKLLALVLLIVTSPILLVVVAMLAIAQHGNIFFIQERPGKNGKVFRLIKFKTMNDGRDADGNMLSDEVRLTKVGKFVRKTSLDELPQMINILKGEMSFIGPRPLLIEYLELYSKEQNRRHEVTPGISGWAQVNGRNTLDWPSKFRYDVWYVDNQSFLLDLKIIFKTIVKVFKAEGISGQGVVTMNKFKGNP
ncbi:MAG: sugar transferase [Bacteroidota bacterium]